MATFGGNSNSSGTAFYQRVLCELNDRPDDDGDIAAAAEAYFKQLKTDEVCESSHCSVQIDIPLHKWKNYLDVLGSSIRFSNDKWQTLLRLEEECPRMYFVENFSKKRFQSQFALIAAEKTRGNMINIAYIRTEFKITKEDAEGKAFGEHCEIYMRKQAGLKMKRYMNEKVEKYRVGQTRRRARTLCPCSIQ